MDEDEIWLDLEDEPEDDPEDEDRCFPIQEQTWVNVLAGLEGDWNDYNYQIPEIGALSSGSL